MYGLKKSKLKKNKSKKNKTTNSIESIDRKDDV